MKNGRFHPSKCRGKVQKTGEETLKGLFSNLLIPTTYLYRYGEFLLVGSNTCPPYPNFF
jgi:hypothetical protein